MSCKIFKLIHGSDELLLEDEPVRWDNLELTLKRDETWHGVNYEFSDGEVQLEFDCVAGADFIDSIYATEGLDAEILFRYEDGVLPPWEGRLLLSTYRRFHGRVACTVERKSLHDVVKSRFDTKADLFAIQDADGNSLPAPNIKTLPFHSKGIRVFFESEGGVEKPMGGVVPPGPPVIIYFNTQDDDTTITGMIQRDFSAVARNEPEPVMVAASAGSFDLLFEYNYVLRTKMERRNAFSRPRYNEYKLETVVEVRRADGSINTQFGYSEIHQQGTSPANKVYFDVSSHGFNSFSQKISLDIGDQLYIYARFSYRVGGSTVNIHFTPESYGSKIRIDAETTVPPTDVKVMLVHESVDRAINVITGKQGVLWSDFLGRTDIGYPVNGCGSSNVITNGFQLRKFREDRPVKVSLKDLMESLNAIYCIGMGYEYDWNGNERMRIERIEHFYRDEPDNASEIIFIGDCDEYEEIAAHELVFNKIEIGYSKYPEEGADMLDEFNTRHEYTTPIRRHDNQFTAVSALIASGYAIELTRREQFFGDKEDKKSTKYDDDNFIVAVRLNPNPETLFTFGTMQFNAVTRTITFYVPLGEVRRIRAGDVLNVSSGPNAGDHVVASVSQTFSTVTYQGMFSNYYIVIVNDPLVQQTVTSTFRPTISILTYTIETERNQAFTVKEDTLLSPSTAYNLRLSPKRMLLNWARWLNGGLMYKSGSELLRNTFVKLNPDLETRLDQSDPCPLGDIGRDAIREGDDIRLASFGERDKLFIPDWVTFAARLDVEDIEKIRAAMTNRSPLNDNYGYISVLSPDGDRVSGWLYEMRWSPATEKVFFRLLKYKVLLNNTVPPDQENCQDYADWTFADFEASNIGAWIEDCRFEDFN